MRSIVNSRFKRNSIAVSLSSDARLRKGVGSRMGGRVSLAAAASKGPAALLSCIATPDQNEKPLSGTRLDSWKEIAVYLKRSVRTVQRWERSEGLPIHRHVHTRLESVYAFREELDAWWGGREQPAGRHRFGKGTLETRLRIAVLPFEPLGDDPADSHFSEGLTEDLIAAFVQLEPERIEVIGVSPVLLSTGIRPEPGVIAQELGAHLVLRGCVRRVGKRVHINAHLIQARDQTHLWAGTYDKIIGNPLSAQTEVVEEISNALPLRQSDTGIRQRCARCPAKSDESLDEHLHDYPKLAVKLLPAGASNPNCGHL